MAKKLKDAQDVQGETENPKVSISAQIRQILAENPKAMPREISTILANKGIKCDASLASQVKSKYKRNAPKSRRGTDAAKAAGRKAVETRQAKSITAHDLLSAKSFATEIGGVGQAIEALKQLEILQV